MKIFLLNDEFYIIGVSIVMLCLVEWLVQNYEVLVLLCIDGQGEVCKQFEVMGVFIVKDLVGDFDVIVFNCIFLGVLVGEMVLCCLVIWWIYEVEIGCDLLLCYFNMVQGFKSVLYIVFQIEFQCLVYGSFLFDSLVMVYVLLFWNDVIYCQ